MKHCGLDFQLSKQFLHDKQNRYARPIVRLSVIGIALGLVVMILALAITAGYKKVLSDKMTDMGAHVRISNLAINYSHEPVPFARHQAFTDTLRKHPAVKNLHYYYTKIGIVKTTDQVEGIVLKGVENDFFNDGFCRNLIEGHVPQMSPDSLSKEILVSCALAKKLQLHVGEKLRLYFVEEPPRQRSFTISGIYETDLPACDDVFAFVDLRQVQKLHADSMGMIGGIEVMLHDFRRSEEVAQFANLHIGTNLKAETIQELYPLIFEWLDMFNTNVAVLLTITTLVCLVTIISTFLIIILEQIANIGILKTMGMHTRDITRIFLYIGTRILLQGMLFGNAIALTLCWLQQHFQLFKLNPETYYVSAVPVNLSWTTLLILNAAILAVCLLTLTIPARIVAKRISPVQAVRFN